MGRFCGLHDTKWKAFREINKEVVNEEQVGRNTSWLQEVVAAMELHVM